MVSFSVRIPVTGAAEDKFTKKRGFRHLKQCKIPSFLFFIVGKIFFPSWINQMESL